MPAAPCGHVAFAPVHVCGAPIAYPSARNRITRPAPRFYSVVTHPNGTHQNDRKKELYPLDRISTISTLKVVAPASKWKEKDHGIEVLMAGCSPTSCSPIRFWRKRPVHRVAAKASNQAPIAKANQTMFNPVSVIWFRPPE